ncbi:MAG: hypothetical protein JRC58_06765 [Deltaproteobacteria bacterium]|nr:hypothetical protein [Deltaproteobacteria bacterium]
MIVEMEQGFRQAREEVVTATADAKRAELHAEECVRAADRWQDNATVDFCWKSSLFSYIGVRNWRILFNHDGI